MPASENNYSHVSVPIETARSLIDLRMKGMRPEAIAKMLDMNYGTVKVYLTALKKQRGLIYPSCSKWTFEKLTEIAELTKGRKYCEVAKMLNVTPALITILMNKYTEMWIDKERNKSAVF